nr:MAG TPA: hypothetical protein [Caudoviricetes sp.]
MIGGRSALLTTKLCLTTNMSESINYFNAQVVRYYFPMS